MNRRKFLNFAAGAAALTVAPSARAQSYPARPVRIIVNVAPGLMPDIMARQIGQWLSGRLGEQFIVENRLGAGGNVATEFVVRAPADGYTLLLVTQNNAVNAALYQNLNFNFIRDIAPVAGLGRSPLVMVVHPSVPAQTVPELIAYAKANPGKLAMASGGDGSPPHVAGELFKMMTGIDMLHVPYRGNMMPDLIGGQVQVYFGTIASSIGFIRAGQLRALGVTTAVRSEVLPDVPAIAEFVPGYKAEGWYGIGAPKTTPTDLIEKLSAEINAGLADPAVKTRLVELGVEPMPMTQAAFGKFIADETDKWGKVVKFASLKLD